MPVAVTYIQFHFHFRFRFELELSLSWSWSSILSFISGVITKRLSIPVYHLDFDFDFDYEFDIDFELDIFRMILNYSTRL